VLGIGCWRCYETAMPLPDADPRSDRPRCGGRESNFLAAQQSIGGLYWDEENHCPKSALPDISHLQDGESIRFPLNLREALAPRG
jgi:hypothetical protein